MGPWYVSKREAGRLGITTAADGSFRGPEMIASVSRYHRRAGEQAANARLIAAAPDLLAACEALEAASACERDDDDADVWVQLRAAIAKASQGD